MKFLVAFVTFLRCAQCFIIPEEFPSLLSLVYSSIPPVKKGTDSRIGLGFRLGPHADFQILLELGPQKHTDPLGSATPDGAAKREVLVMRNPLTLVDYVNNIRNYFTANAEQQQQQQESENKRKTGDKVSDTEGGKWIDWWRNNVLTQKEIGKIEFNKIPGIDDRIETGSIDSMILVENNDKKPVVDHLEQLYRKKSVKT